MRLPVLSTVSFLVLAALLPHPARAGFEFIAPVAAPVAASSGNDAPIVSNAPVASEALQTLSTLPAGQADAPMVLGAKAVPLTPVVKDSDALIVDDVSHPPPPPVASVSADIPPAMPLPLAIPAAKEIVQQAKREESILWNDDAGMASEVKTASVQTVAPVVTSGALDDGHLANGFGKDVPLALALQQIVPPEYRYSFDYGINPGMRVSWSGGKPWKSVITDLARDNNMNVDIVNNVIAFRRRDPMEIVSAQSGVDTTPDMVQGMALKPVTPTLSPVLPSFVPSPMPSPVIADAEPPMALLKNPQPAARQALASIGENDLPPATIVTERSEVTSTDPVNATVKTTAVEKQTTVSAVPAFDSLLDGDKPAAAKVKQKEILVAEDTTMPSVLAAPVPPPAQTMLDQAPPTKTPVNIHKTETVTETQSVTSAPTPIMPAPMPPVQIASASPIMPVMDDAAAMPEAVDLSRNAEWNATKGSTLREVLTRWTEESGVSLVWSSEYDYPLQTDVRIKADFPDAVRTILAGFAKAQPRPLGKLFKNKSVGAQPVLVIETQRLTQ